MQILVKVVMEKTTPDTSHLPINTKSLVSMCLEEQEKRSTSVEVLRATLVL